MILMQMYTNAVLAEASKTSWGGSKTIAAKSHIP